MATELMIPDHFTTQFDHAWMHLAQQEESRLVESVTRDSITGERKSYNQIEDEEMDEITTRLGETPVDEIETRKRWVYTRQYEKVSNFDEWDRQMLGEIPLPQSETIQTHAFAYNRRQDRTIIDALGGTAIVGDDGTDTEALPSTQKIAVNFVGPGGTPANSGLTLAKLIGAKSKFGKNEALRRNEKLYLVHTQQQLDDLLYNANEVKSSDYAQVKALVDGEVDHFMGMTFIRTELLPLDAGTDIRSCYVYTSRAIKFVNRVGRQVHADILPTRRHSLQIRTKASMGATRMEEVRVVEIATDESP